MCHVRECYRGHGGLVVMDVICVSMILGMVIYLFWVGNECDEWAEKYLFRACNV